MPPSNRVKGWYNITIKGFTFDELVQQKRSAISYLTLRVIPENLEAPKFANELNNIEI